jgi:hypothetical protein
MRAPPSGAASWTGGAREVCGRPPPRPVVTSCMGEALRAVRWPSSVVFLLALFACFIIRIFQFIFLIGTIFFSHNKSANSTFSHNFSAKRTGSLFLRNCGVQSLDKRMKGDRLDLRRGREREHLGARTPPGGATELEFYSGGTQLGSNGFEHSSSSDNGPNSLVGLSHDSIHAHSWRPPSPKWIWISKRS